MSDPIELRSDTFTVPSTAMREAIASAKVGDDVWGEDPTVLELQERVADLLGKEAGLFVPSGTMANQVATLCHINPGEKVLLGWGSHCLVYEAGAGAAFAGAMYHVLGNDGHFTAEEVEAALLPENVHFPPATLVWLENTHNQASGRIFPQDRVEAICRVAHERRMAVHLDGARLMNAAVASGCPAKALAAPVDSTSICLSKGLGAPVGSVLAGSRAFIAKAHRFRKMLGGGMRQVGILAAAGLYALEHNIERLAEDHANARFLAEGLARIPGIRLNLEHVQTNIVIFGVDRPGLDISSFIGACAGRGLRLSPASLDRARAVTHMHVSREQCQAAVRIIRQVLGD